MKRPNSAPPGNRSSGRCFFLLASSRSGSTSLARILDSATNGCCKTEPAPNLNRETRLAMDGRLTSKKHEVVEQLILPRVSAGLSAHEIYGEKSVTYGPFVRDLHALTNCHFVYQTRDGRDVVRSMVDWHTGKFGSVYREAANPGKLSAEALLAAAALPVHLDASDFSRPRPQPDDPLFAEWPQLRRWEMCTYYWRRKNELYLSALAELPSDAYVRIDYTSPTASDVLEVANFLGLKGLSQETVKSALDSRINSLADRGSETATPAPHWTNWSSGDRDTFDRIAGDTMCRLGYYSNQAARWRPAGYGSFWQTHDGGLEWYEWMFKGRQAAHRDLFEWIAAHPEFISIADLGCGLSVGYADELSEREYCGFDLSAQNIDWCQKHRKNPLHRFVCSDFVDTPTGKFDLVFSQGTIDNSYDIDEYLRSAVRMASKWIYITAYRGWFPQISQHRYTWNAAHGCFYNDLSPARVTKLLETMGCKEIEVSPLKTHNREIPYETRIVARVAPEGGITPPSAGLCS